MIVSLPTANPFAGVGATPVSVAMPPLSAAVPTATPFTANATVPAGVVPPPVAATVAVKLWVAVVLPSGIEVGMAVTVVVVVGSVTTVTVTDPEADDAANVLSPLYAMATVCVPAVLNDVTVEAVPPLSVIALPATPSIVTVTVPLGVVVTVELPEATVAVSVTLSLTSGAGGETDRVVVETVRLAPPSALYSA